ncbi:MAG: hypothetical protein H6724_11415 [Sandaracinus sp.]|nr:hypothetical protein [Sandaracinus sp.]
MASGQHAGLESAATSWRTGTLVLVCAPSVDASDRTARDLSPWRDALFERFFPRKPGSSWALGSITNGEGQRARAPAWGSRSSAKNAK